jgi:hypothetical protein
MTKEIPIIAFFNHKGGVSKTTTTFNLGWALADAGKKVMIVDGDPQCNLTGTVLGFDGIDDFAAFYKKNPNANISDALSPVFSGAGTPLKPPALPRHRTKTSIYWRATSRSPKTKLKLRLPFRRVRPFQHYKTFQDQFARCFG